MNLGLVTEGQLVETEAWGSVRPCTGSHLTGRVGETWEAGEHS